MEWRKRSAGLTLLFAGTAVFAGGCAGFAEPEVLPEATVEAYEAAFNNMDINGMLECMDETSRNALVTGMDTTIGLLGDLVGLDLGIGAEEMMALLPIWDELGGNESLKEDYPQADFQVLETYIDGDRATVHILEAYSGVEENWNLKKQDGRWYLTLGGREVTEDTAERILTAGGEAGSETEGESGKEDNWELTIPSIDGEKIGEILRILFEEG